MFRTWVRLRTELTALPTVTRAASSFRRFERAAVRGLYWDMLGGILPHPASAGTSRRADRDAPAAQAGALPFTEVHDETVVSDRYQLHYDLRTGEKQLARGWPTGRRVAVLRHRTCASSVLGVANYALAGYGTLQSFLLWKEKSSSGIDSMATRIAR